MIDLKKKIIKELNKSTFPNLEFLYSDEVLNVALNILWELLKEDKKEFEKLLNIKLENLTFDSFETESVLNYFWSLLNHLKNVNNAEKIRNIIENFRPDLEDFWNYVAYNKKYFDLLEYVQNNLKLDKEQERIMYLRIKSFKDRWINLDEKKQNRLKQINKELSKLSEKFENNIIDDQAKFEYFIDDFEVIKDLPEDVLKNTKEGAEKKWKYWWLFDADPSAYVAIMKYAHNSKIRNDFEKARNTFASTWKYDNREVVLKILKFKEEKAKILWYKNYAELSLNSKMADSPEQVFDLIGWINKKAKNKFNTEIDELKKYFNLTEINSYDLSYYSTKLKEEKYNIDDKEIKKYFELENVLDYLFQFVKNFFWVELKQIKIPVYNEDVKIFEVYKSGKLISYYFIDLFYRKNKRPGAWADDIRDKNHVWESKTPIIVNVCNFQKSSSEILLSMRDVETIFHEFGHALHFMLSESKYGELNWFSVEWDFVELPSQILENWVWDKESLVNLAKHYKTWERLSNVVLNKLEELNTFMSWSFVARQNEFALFDMNIYSDDVPDSVDDLDNKVLEIVNKFSIFKRDENYKMYTSFGHIFWWWYAAWYYSYMWAEIIEADIFDRIKSEWMFNSEVWEKFIKTILWQWTRKKAKELFYDFMWRDVDNKAFMTKKGL